MTSPEETPEQRVARYEAGAIQGDQGPAGFWFNLLQAAPAERFRMVARCTEHGWVGPDSVAWLAGVLELPATASWDEIVAKARALVEATTPDPEPEPEPEPIEPPARAERHRG